MKHARKLNILLGATLLEVIENGHASNRDDTVQIDSCPRLTFDNGILKIHNPFTLKCDSGERLQFDAIVGCTVTNLIDNPSEFSIVLDGHIVIAISLKEEDFIGADAAVFYPSASGEAISLNQS